VGINSHVTSANLREERGYLVYAVLVKDGYNNSHKVIVDPGNGKVLFTKQMSNNDQSEHDDNVVYKFNLYGH
jgi:hypothetical protein